MARDIKKYIEKKVRERVEEFQKSPGVTTEFGEAVIGYVSVFHPVFDALFAREFNNHPKEIYNPGHSVVLAFAPFSDKLFRKLEAGGCSSEEWTKAYYDSIHLGMYLNRTMKEALYSVGRLVSITGVPTDWNEELHMPKWSEKIAAYLAGMGSLGPGGSLHIDAAYAGAMGSIITDGCYASEPDQMSEEEIETEVQKIKDSFCYKGFSKGVSCCDDMIAACPASAIDGSGIDRKICLEFCRSLNSSMPCPDVCARCYRFR